MAAPPVGHLTCAAASDDSSVQRFAHLAELSFVKVDVDENDVRIAQCSTDDPEGTLDLLELGRPEQIQSTKRQTEVRGLSLGALPLELEVASPPELTDCSDRLPPVCGVLEVSLGPSTLLSLLSFHGRGLLVRSRIERSQEVVI